MWPFTPELTPEWSQSPWKGKYVDGEHARRRAAPRDFGNEIAKRARQVSVPFHVWVTKPRAIGQDAAGRIVMWGFGLMTLWSDAARGRDDREMTDLIGEAYANTDGIGQVASGVRAYADYAHALEGTRVSLGTGPTREWRCNFRLRHFRDPREIGVALKRLGSTDLEARMRAVETLAKIEDPAHADLLVSLLADASPGVRTRAAETLARLGIDHPKLMAYIDSRVQETRWALGTLGALAVRGSSSATERLSKQFDDAHSVPALLAEVRKHLSRAGRPAVPALMRALRSTDRMIRLQGIIGLGETGDAEPEAVRDLLGLLDSQDWEWVSKALVRMNAVEACDAVEARLIDVDSDSTTRDLIDVCEEAHNDFAMRMLARFAEGGKDGVRATAGAALARLAKGDTRGEGDQLERGR
jgi:HEAT repeat protein